MRRDEGQSVDVEKPKDLNYSSGDRMKGSRSDDTELGLTGLVRSWLKVGSKKEMMMTHMSSLN